MSTLYKLMCDYFCVCVFTEAFLCVLCYVDVSESIMCVSFAVNE